MKGGDVAGEEGGVDSGEEGFVGDGFGGSLGPRFHVLEVGVEQEIGVGVVFGGGGGGRLAHCGGGVERAGW